ncbi:aspartyl-phosphate phosphatase Spo0E family protein [Clostridium sp. MT-14]|nr:aspartyl-phosphate phosphatase Spo0E family protein [Clostridium sp. HV4-5-A1G]KAA8668995.1 aspartyl-phosphate phosphatase Spo0E family protein [Clostridium sp. HV4-5-A1G]CAB1249715.1 Spo0E like sporulation regulatory protein [Clostridiaceae bacterium BL-3]
MEDLKEELNRCISLYGLLDERTIKISQKLDELIVQKLKEDEEQ